MTATNTYLFDPNLAEIADDAFERIGMDPATVTGRHIRSFRRSLNLLLSQWNTREIHQWATVRAQQTVAPGMQSFQLPTGALDILTMVVRRDGSDTELNPIGRDEYLAIADKDIRGRPDRFFVDRQIGRPTVYIWQAGENSTDVLDFWYVRRLQDGGTGQNTPDVPVYFTEALTAGMAMKLAEKYAPERLQEKAMLYEAAFREALIEGGSRADLHIEYRR